MVSELSPQKDNASDLLASSLSFVAPLHLKRLHETLADRNFTILQLLRIAAFTHPGSPAIGNPIAAGLLVGDTQTQAEKAQKWFLHKKLRDALLEARQLWVDIVTEPTEMDRLLERLYFITQFDIGRLYTKGDQGQLALKDLTKENTRGLKRIKVDTKTVTKRNQDGTETTTITQHEEIEAHDLQTAARLFAQVKGALRAPIVPGGDSGQGGPTLIINLNAPNTGVHSEPLVLNRSPVPALPEEKPDGPSQPEGDRQPAGVDGGGSPDAGSDDESKQGVLGGLDGG